MNMDKEALKFYFFAIPVGIVFVLMILGAAYWINSLIEDDDTGDTWSDFADKSNQYTDYTIEKFKGYDPDVNTSTTSARITYTSGDTFSMRVDKEPNLLKWYYLYADDKGIRIEYHIMNYSSAASPVDRIPSVWYIPYESIMSVYVNNLPSEY